MNSAFILATNWNDFVGQIIDGWWGELAGPYRVTFWGLMVVTTMPWVVSLFAKRKSRGIQQEPATSPRTAVFTSVGG